MIECWFQSNPIQSNPIQSNPIQSNAIQSNPIRSNPIQSNPMQCNAMQSNAMQCNPIQCKSIQSNPIQCNPMQSNAIQFNPIQSNANQQEESMNSSGVSHSVTHLDHGSIVQYPGSLQLVQEFGLDSVIRVRHIDCRCSSVIQSSPQESRDTRCIQSNERERERIDGMDDARW